MANNFGVTPGTGLTFKSTDNAGVQTPHHNVELNSVTPSVNTGSADSGTLRIAVANATSAGGGPGTATGGGLRILGNDGANDRLLLTDTTGMAYVKGGVTGGYRLVLIGLGVGALLGSYNSLLMVRGQVEQAVSANIWIAGSLDGRQWTQVLPVYYKTVRWVIRWRKRLNHD